MAEVAHSGNQSRRVIIMPRNWSEKDLRTLHKRKGLPLPPVMAVEREDEYKSNLERRWAHYLNGLLALRTIDGWIYEAMNFRLPGQKNYYKIDFITWKGKAVTFYSVKGRNKSDDRALVKLKTAAGLHPWATFIEVKLIDGQWQERVFQ